MSEKLTNNNIDDIFRDSINNMETQPSEEFWIKTSESALFKSTQAGKKAVGRWRLVAAALAIALVSLSAYIVYMQKQIGDINQRLAVAEKHNSTKQVINEPVSNEATLKPIVTTQKQNLPESTALVNHSLPASHSNKSSNALGSAPYVKNSVRKSSSNPPGSIVLSGISNQSTISGQSVAANNNESKNNSNQSLSTSIVSLNGIENNSIPQNNSEQSLLLTDNIASVQSDIKPIEPKNVLSKFSIAAFYMPYISDELFENDATDIVNVNNVSANEEEINPYAIGLKFGYDISKHFTVTTGCLFYNFNVSVSPTTIYAQKQQDGDVGYSFQTSIGKVVCPYGNPPKVGDGIIVSGEEYVNYISIPLQIKYNFITNSRWGVYVTAGLIANIVARREMDMHWQDFKLEEGSAKEGIDVSKKVYGSYYIASGISYRMFKGLSLFIEPSLEGSPIFSYAKNTIPYIGVGSGIVCHF